MRHMIALAALLAASLCMGHTNQPITKLLKAEYTIYAGELGDELPPTRADRKLAIEISGQAAKDIFDSIYPDATVKCSAEEGERLRRKKNLWCSFHPKDGYRCYMGFDLRTGDSIPGASC